MSVGVAEVGAPAAHGVLTAIDLPDLLACRIAVVGDPAVLDAGEGGVELLLADYERVVVWLEVVQLVVVQTDLVGQRDRREVCHRRIDTQAEDVGQELRRGLRVTGGDDGVIQFRGHGDSSSGTGLCVVLPCHTLICSNMCGYDTMSSLNSAAMRWNSGLPNAVASASVDSQTATFIRSWLSAVPLCICRETNPG